MTISLSTKRSIALAKGYCGKCYTRPTKIRNGVQLKTCDECLLSQARYQKKQDERRSVKRTLSKQGLPLNDGFCIECQASWFHRSDCPKRHMKKPIPPTIAFETQSEEPPEE